MPPKATTFGKSVVLKISLPFIGLMILLTSVVAIVIVHKWTNGVEEATFTKGKLAANIGAQSYGTILEEAVNQGQLTLQEVFDHSYIPIEGYDWGENSKYHTHYDSITDRVMLLFQDRFLDDPHFVYAVGVDINGYVPTHNTVYQKPITGQEEQDKLGNRSKRIFNDKIGMAAAKNTKNGFRQKYLRDTGETTWDISSPIFVKGRQWGGFRVGLAITEIEQQKSALIFSLLLMFGVFLVLLIVSVYVIIKRALAPLGKLTTEAEQISMGEGLATPLQSDSSDELGRLTKALDRLRTSMKAAMERLGD